MQNQFFREFRKIQYRSLLTRATNGLRRPFCRNSGGNWQIDFSRTPSDGILL